MEVVRSATVHEFMALAGPFLEEREAEHNLIFGICSHLLEDSSQYAGPPYLAAVIHGERVVGAAIRTPPWRLVLSMVDHPGAVHQLVQDLAGEPLPGVVGPAEPVHHFAASWAATTEARVRLSRHERSFRLTRVIAPRPAPGATVVAGPEHVDVLRAWAKAFHDEALPGGPAQDYQQMAERWARRVGRTAYLWLDGGEPVSLACVGGPTPNGIRVGPVYTPPDRRGRGYASNVVAAASQAQLDAGRRFVFLFTDLANPTANRIYQDIGYEPVIDIDEVEFDPA